VFNTIAAVLLFILMVLGTIDVIGRYVFNAPIVGTMERGQVLLALMVFLSWGYTQIKKGHVRVELFIARFPPRIRAVMDFATTFLTLIFFILIVWQSTVMAFETQKNRGSDICHTLAHGPLSAFGPHRGYLPLSGFNHGDDPIHPSNSKGRVACHLRSFL
jgi:hypothetical protein